MPYTTALQQNVIRYCNVLLLYRVTPNTVYVQYNVYPSIQPFPSEKEIHIRWRLSIKN